MRHSPFFAVSLACLASMVAAHPAEAAGYPDRPVKIVVAIAPGGAVDTTARLIAASLTDKWGQPVVVENRAGADSTIGEEYVAHSRPDGYTIQVVDTSHSAIPAQNVQLNYDPIKDFAPITQLTIGAQILVINQKFTPVKSVKELIAYARARPGKLNYGSGGESTTPALAMKLINQRAGIDTVNVIYKGLAPATVALLAGEIHILFGSTTTVGEQIRSGQLQPLAVSGAVRLGSSPEIPTVAEAADLPGFDISTWQGVLAPVGVPQDILAKLHDDIVAVVNLPAPRKTMENQGYNVVGNTPAEFSQFIDRQVAISKELQKMLK